MEKVYEKLYGLLAKVCSCCHLFVMSLHGNYGQPVYSSRESAQLVQFASCLHTPRPKTDGVIAVGWLADQIVTVVCRIPSQRTSYHLQDPAW